MRCGRDPAGGVRARIRRFFFAEHWKVGAIAAELGRSPRPEIWIWGTIRLVLHARRRDELALLGSPPRRVPFSVRAHLLFDSFFAQFGWLFLGIGMFIPLIVYPVHPKPWDLVLDPAASEGVVIGCRLETRPKRHTRALYEVRYRYEVNGEVYAGVSYSEAPCMSPGTAVVVDHSRADPRRSLIRGMRRSKMEMWGVALVAVFPLAGVLILSVPTVLSLQMIRRLRYGELLNGTLLRSEETRFEVNGVRLVRCWFAVEPRTGHRREVPVYTLRPAQFDRDRGVPLLVLPGHTPQALAWDLVAPVVSLDARGVIKPVPFARAMVPLAPVAVALASHLVAAFLVH